MPTHGMTASEGRSLGPLRVESPPIKERLQARRQTLDLEVLKIDELLELLERNPGIEKFVDLMGGIQF